MVGTETASCTAGIVTGGKVVTVPGAAVVGGAVGAGVAVVVVTCVVGGMGGNTNCGAAVVVDVTWLSL